VPYVLTLTHRDLSVGAPGAQTALIAARRTVMTGGPVAGTIAAAL